MSCTRKSTIVVAVVGHWPALTIGMYRRRRIGKTVIYCCPSDPRALRNVALDAPLTWLLVGLGIDDPTIRTLIHVGRSMARALRLAMLGDSDDFKRCERWTRRGCLVYVQGSATVMSVINALRASMECDGLIVDRVFFDLARARTVQPLENLTRREEEVLHLLSLGQRNADIAVSLGLRENTIEFHLRNIFDKLGARNRVEAVERASALGL